MYGSHLATAAPQSPPPAPAITDNQRQRRHASRSHPHPSPSQTGSRAASSPPRAGRNFFGRCKRSIYWAFAISKCRYRAERLANRAGQGVENPWNLIAICSGSRRLGFVPLRVPKTWRARPTSRGANNRCATVRETAASRQFIVAEPFSAKVPDSHAAAKVEEGIVGTDAHSAGVLVTPLGQRVCWQMGENMLFDVPADQLRDLRPPPFRQGIERIVWLFVLGHSSAIRRGT